MKYFLKSERLGFRKWNKKDIPVAMELWGDHNVTKLIDSRGQLSEEQVKERLEKEIECNNKYNVQYWPFFLLYTGENVGCGGLKPYDPEKNMYEIGIHVRSDFWRKGYAFEAAKTVIKYAFGKLNISELFAGHNPANESSESLLKKLGFTFTHHEYYPSTGLYHPSYSLKHDEYAAKTL